MNEIDPTQDTVRIRPRRVYKCKHENKYYLRSEVKKDEHGIYWDKKGHIVEDVTNTITAQDLMEIICI